MFLAMALTLSCVWPINGRLMADQLSDGVPANRSRREEPVRGAAAATRQRVRAAATVGRKMEENALANRSQCEV
jgi:hypothetical protein